MKVRKFFLIFYIEKFKDKILINFSNGNMYYFDESNLNKKI